MNDTNEQINSKPLATPISLNSHCFKLAFWNSMQYNGNVSYFRSIQSLIRGKLKSTLGVCYAVDLAFKTWKSLLFTRRVFNPSKKVLKCFMNSVRNVLFNLGKNFRMQTCKKFIKIISVECRIVFFVDRYRKFTKFIIDVFADIKRVKKFFLLVLRRIQSVFIRSEFHVNIAILKEFLSLCIHPTSKEVGFLLRIS